MAGGDDRGTPVQPAPSARRLGPLPVATLREDVLACPECDLLHRVPRAADLGGEAAFARAGRNLECTRCGGPLGLARHGSFDLPAALALAALVSLAIAHLNPVMAIEIQGQGRSATLWQAAWTLYDEGAWFMGVLVLLTTFVCPVLETAAICYVLLPLSVRRLAPGYAPVLRAVQAVRPWVMVEVFMLGVLVAFVKLSALASVVPGVGLWAFAATMLLLAAVASTFDMEHVWEVTAPQRAVRTRR
jgi:paraquat-inducible protein A